MRIGGPVFVRSEDPEELVRAHHKKGYRAGLCPDFLKLEDTRQIAAVRETFAAGDIVIAEVGAWCNPLTLHADEARKNIDYVAGRLALADEVDAKCCVNIVGTWSEANWYGPDAKNYSADFFDHAVDVSRQIIDQVNPKRTQMTFELMPYSFLDSASEYMRFLKALDRPAAGVHFDPVNCISSARLYYNSTAFFKDCFAIFGDDIASIHLKDIKIRSEPFSVMFDEVPIGTGQIDYVALMNMLAKLPEDTPVLLEHLPDEAAYDKAAGVVRASAEKAGVSLSL